MSRDLSLKNAKFFPYSLLFGAMMSASNPVASALTDVHNLSQLPNGLQIPFVANNGQVANNAVKFYAKTPAATVFVMQSGNLVYSFPQLTKKNSAQSWALRENLSDTSSTNIQARHKSATSIRYFNGERDVQPGISAYQEISLGNPYEGIEVLVKAHTNNVEKLFVVSADADASLIRVSLDGIKSLSVTKTGALDIVTGLGSVTFTAPVAYQQTNGKREYIEVAYQVTGNEYGFKLGDYDHSREVIIDPLVESTFLGGGNRDRIVAVEVTDSAVYLTGRTTSVNFPVSFGAVIDYQGGLDDAFIARLTPDLSTLLSATFLGGSAQEYATDLALEGDYVYISGLANSSTGIPTTAGAYKATGSGGWVAKFSSDLGTLEAATFVGGSANSLTVKGGNVYVIGQTASTTSFTPSPNAFDTDCGTDGKCNPSGSFGSTASDVTISKLNDTLTTQIAGTYLGGSGSDYGSSIVVDDSGFVYATGETRSTNFPTTVDGYSGRYSLANPGLPSAFVAKLNSDFTNLLSSSYLNGSSGASVGTAITLGNNSVYITGGVNAEDFPTSADAYDNSVNGAGGYGEIGIEGDVFIARMDTTLQTIEAATYYGGSMGDTPSAITVTGAGGVVVTGRTRSNNLPTTSGAHDSSLNGVYDAFVAAFDGNLTTLSYATYLGGSTDDFGYDVTADSEGQIYVVGATEASDFPTTTNVFNTTHNGDDDGFVSVLDIVDAGGSNNGGGDGTGDANISPIADAGNDFTTAPKKTAVLDGSGSSDADGVMVSYQWTKIKGPKRLKLSNSDTAIAKFNAPGVKRGKTKTLVFELTVIDNKGSVSTDQVVVSVSR